MSPELSSLGMFLLGCVKPPVVVESWMLLALLWVELTFMLANYKDKPQPPCMSKHGEVSPWGRVIPSWVWCLLESPCGCAACVISWVELWYSLKPTTGCVCSESNLVGSMYRLMSYVVCNQPWATFLEIPCYSLYVVVSPGSVCACEGPICVQGSTSSSCLELVTDL